MGGGVVFDAAIQSSTVHCGSAHPGHDKRLQHIGQYWDESDWILKDLSQTITTTVYSISGPNGG